MWSFKKKQMGKDPTVERFEKLERFRKVGETFNYLGRTCIVTNHSVPTPWGPEPRLCFDYCDNAGVIHHLVFSVAELPALMGQYVADEKMRRS